MIIYTNAGNPFGLKLLICAKFAKKDVQVKTIALNGKIFFCVVRNVGLSWI